MQTEYDNDETNSTSGYVFTLGGGAVSWKPSKQMCKARSTMELEFVALEMAGTEAEWLRTLLADIPLWTKPATSISQSRYIMTLKQLLVEQRINYTMGNKGTCD